MACDNFLQFCEAAEGGNLVGKAKKPEGETTDATHKGWLEIKSFEFGAENPTTIGSVSGGAGAGKVKFQPFKITKEVDKSSPAIFTACAAGAHFPTVFLGIRKAGGAQADYLKYAFRLVYVTSISWSGGGGEEAPEETVEFVYGALGIKYLPQSSTGEMGSPLFGMWSQQTNKPELKSPGISSPLPTNW
jgi:type VI secretion system secreted protein Hcp